MRQGQDWDSHISDLTRAGLLLKLLELETQRIKHGFFRTQLLSVSAQHPTTQLVCESESFMI